MYPEQIIGNNIKRIRKERGIKIETLGKYLNITKGRMSQIENGNCKALTINRIKKISEFLKVDFFDLIYNEEQALKADNNRCEPDHSITPEFVSAVLVEFANRLNIH